MANRSCCVCNQKIGFWNEQYNLEDEDGKEYTLCVKCRKMLSDEDNYEIKRDYFESLFSSNTVETKMMEYIRSELTKILEKEEEELKEKEQEKKLQEDLLQRREEFASRKIGLYDNKLITTGLTFDGYKIVSYHGVVSGDVVIGTGVFSELTAGISDLFGTKSSAFSQKMITVKKAAQEILIEEALKAGGNAIIGVDFDYVTFGNNILGVSANGTAVKVEKE